MSEYDKKCPKCGGKANIHVFRFLTKKKEFRVFCETCGFRTTAHFEKEDAQIEWCELCKFKERMKNDG